MLTQKAHRNSPSGFTNGYRLLSEVKTQYDNRSLPIIVFYRILTLIH